MARNPLIISTFAGLLWGLVGLTLPVPLVSSSDPAFARLRTLGNTEANSAEIEFNGARLFLLHLTFDSYADVYAGRGPGHRP